MAGGTSRATDMLAWLQDVTSLLRSRIQYLPYLTLHRADGASRWMTASVDRHWISVAQGRSNHQARRRGVVAPVGSLFCAFLVL